MSFGNDWGNYRCCPQGNPQGIGSSFASVYVRGYIYKRTPEWYTQDGAMIMPLNFWLDPPTMTYKWLFSGIEYPSYLLPSDDVFPIVFDDKERLKVKRVSFHNGYTTWKIYT